MLIRVLPVSALLITVFLSGNVSALNFGWLDTSPLRYFDDRDWDLFRGAMQKALDSGTDGETASWHNPDSDAKGSIKLINSYQEESKQCRKVEISNAARGLTGGGIFRLCKTPGETWKISP